MVLLISTLHSIIGFLGIWGPKNRILLLSFSNVMSTEASKKDFSRNSGLKKCFAALVDRKQVNLDLEVLKLMLKHELLVNVDSLDENLSMIMPYMLVIYIRNWPGWQRSKEYYSGKLNFRDWYEKFRQYVIVRMNFLIKNGYDQAINMIRDEKKFKINQLSPSKAFEEHGTQTDILAPKGVAPFSISIEGPPKILSSLVFAESGDDIVLKENTDHLPWSEISLQHFLNWPHVGIEFFSPELSFKRFNRGEYSRFLKLSNCPNPQEKNDFIEQVEILNPSSPRYCYTFRLLKNYTRQYLDVVKSINYISKTELDNMAHTIEEFLIDIKEIGMNDTMASNTSVLFNIGRSSYIRNTKSSKESYVSGPKLEVEYCEMFTPRMELHLNYFKGVQDTTTTDVTFSYLNILKKTLAANTKPLSASWSVPVLVFHCLFCNIQYTNYLDIIHHFKAEHHMESNYLCTKCRNSFSICSLTKSRWKHTCGQASYSQSSSSVSNK